MTSTPRVKVKKDAPRNRKEPISPARKAAFEILMAVERSDGHSDDLLRAEGVSNLPPADRNLTTALVLGVLRWQIRLDHQLRSRFDRRETKLDVPVLIALRIGAFQILHMDRIPAHAAINDSVELAKLNGHRFAAGMVNAVLRKIAGATAEPLPEDTVAEIALAEGHPAWMVERWCACYGNDKARAICGSDQVQPPLVIRISDDAVEPELTKSGIRVEVGSILCAARVVSSGDVFSSHAFREGRIRVQDEGSQLVAELAAANLTLRDGRILDACAAPGGKTLILVERNPKAHVVACENSVSRLEQLRQRLDGHRTRIECRFADASALNGEGDFDLALADVPCSGTGTLGRNPEIRHRLRIEDLARQSERQRAILKSVLASLKVGGRAVYSTCSLEMEENDEVIAAVLCERPDVRLISLEATIDSLQRTSVLTDDGARIVRSGLTPAGTLRLLPGLFHTDGFFVALIERSF